MSPSSPTSGRHVDDDYDDEHITVELTRLDGATALDRSVPAPPPAYSAAAISRRCSVRIAIGVVFVVALWATNLQLAAYIASAIVAPPSLVIVAEYWSSSAQETVQVADVYALCVESAHTSCVDVYNATMADLVAQTNAIAAANVALVASVTASAALCQSAYTAAVAALNTYTAATNNPAPMYAPPPTCSADSRAAVAHTIGDLSQSKSAANHVNAQYSHHVSALTESAWISAGNYSAYNEWYWKRKIFNLSFAADDIADLTINFPSIQLTPILAGIDANIADLMLCVYGQNVDIDLCPFGSLADDMSAVQSGIETAYNDAVMGYTIFATAVATFSDAAVSAINTAVEFLDYLAPFEDALTTIDVTLPIPQLNVLSPFTFPDPPLAVAIVTNVPAFPSVHLQLESIMAPIEAGFRAAVDAVRDETVTAVQDLVNDILAISIAFPNEFSDYQPPPLDLQINAIAAQLQVDSLSFINESGISIGNIHFPFDMNGTLNFSSASSLLSRVTSNVSAALRTDIAAYADASLSASGTGVSTAARQLAVFGGSVDVEAVVIGIVAALALLIILDYAYRAYATMHIAFSQFNQPTADMSPIDVRTDAHRPLYATSEAASSSSSAQSVMSVTTTAMRFMTTPFVLYAIIAAFLVVALIGFVGVYVPQYNSYVTNCVQTDRGTFFSNNTFVILYNFARIDGDARGLVEAVEYDVRAATDCLRLTASTWTTQVRLQAAMNAAVQQMTTANANIQQLLTCLPLDQFSNNSSVMAALANSAIEQCNAAAINATSTLFDGRFNCSQMPSCDAPDSCDVNRQTLRASAFDTACTTEEWIHGGLMLFALIILIYLCWTVSRSFIVKGAMCFCWRDLSINGITVIACTDANGHLYQATERRLQRLVPLRVAAYERTALLYFIGALLAHIPYLSALFVLSDPFGWFTPLDITDAPMMQ